MTLGIRYAMSAGRLATCAAAAALALGAAAPAFADSSAVVGAVGHSQVAFGSGDIVLANTANFTHAAARTTNDLEDGVFAPPIDGNHFLDSGVEAFFNSPTDLANNLTGRGIYGTSTTNFLSLDHLTQPGTVDLASEATLSASDLISITGAPGDNREVIFHTGLEVVTQTIDHREFNAFDSDTDFLARGHTQIRLDGTGIGLSDQGNDIFFESSLSARPGRQGLSTFGAPAIIPVDVRMTLGQLTALDLTLDDTTTMSIDDRLGNLSSTFRFDDSFALTWSGQVSVTDANTGATLCGLSIHSDEGENFGSIAACPGGGGGAGGVPEPASWALMIAGFALSGAMLRARRRVLAG
jgi:hypothetical protein